MHVQTNCTYYMLIYYSTHGNGFNAKTLIISPKMMVVTPENAPNWMVMLHICAHLFMQKMCRNVELLNVEVGKPKPHVEVLRDLMRHTFPNRWDAYVNNNEPSTLLRYLFRYPLLKKTAFVRSK